MATSSSFLRPTSPPKSKAKMRTYPSTTSPLAPELPNTGPSFIPTPGPSIASSSSSIGTHNRHFRPRKRSHFHSSTPPTPRSTPCPPRSNYSDYGKDQHQHQNMLPYIPTIPPHATLPSLEAHRIHLLDQIQATDFDSTTILRSLHAIQSQLDHPFPLPPHEVKALTRHMKIHRWALWRSEEKEMDILVRLGEVALRTQRIGRWERVCWEAQQGVRHGLTAGENWMVEPPAMNGQAYGAQNVYRVSSNGCPPAPPHIQAYGTQSEGANPTSHNLGAPVPVDAGYQYPDSAEQLDSSPPCVGLPAHPSIALRAMDIQQAQHLTPSAFAWQHPPGSASQGCNYYDNTSHVTSAATTRRNTAIGSMLPPSVPHNSRHGSIAAPAQGFSGSDLSQRIEQAVGNGRFRKSEPGLVGQWSAEGQGHAYV